MKLFTLHKDLIILVLTLSSLFSCKRERRDASRVLLYENLESRYVKKREMLHSSIWIPVTRKVGPYMYLGDETYTGSIIKYFENG